MLHVRYVDICRGIYLSLIFLLILIMVPVIRVMDSGALRHFSRLISSVRISLFLNERSFHGQLTPIIVLSSMSYVSMRRSMPPSPIANSQKKNAKKYSTEFPAHSRYPIYRNMMKESLIVLSMSDSSPISNVDTKNQICEMMHFSKESKTLPRNKYVEVVSDIDSKKSIFPYWYEEKILAK